jgi:hypothetical protein
MKEEVIKMIYKGDTDQKKCKRKEFEYLINQETVRERKIHENYLKQQFIREIPKDREDAIFKNLRKEVEDPSRFEDGVMIQERHKNQPLATAVSQCMMLRYLQEKLDFPKRKKNIEEERYHNLQVHKKEVYNSILFSHSIFNPIYLIYFTSYKNVQFIHKLIQITNHDLRNVFMFPLEDNFYSHYNCLLNDDQLVRVQCKKPVMSRSGSWLVVQCHSSNLGTKNVHRYPVIKEKENAYKERERKRVKELWKELSTRVEGGNV